MGRTNYMMEEQSNGGEFRQEAEAIFVSVPYDRPPHSTGPLGKTDEAIENDILANSPKSEILVTHYSCAVPTRSNRY